MPISVSHLSYVYSGGTPYEKKAIDDLNFVINEGESVGIIGSTGSGKSTLIQHFNGLIKLTSGDIKVFDIDLAAKKPDYKLLRKGIGMLFQYPEYQLFAETVLEDVMFGPLNFGADKEQARKDALEALRMVGLTDEKLYERSPIEISGGQKRRVAIAGVLAYKPKVLILDEPTAGLDPVGKREMLSLVRSLKGTFVNTVIMVSHNMDEIAEFTDRVLVLHDSKLLYDTTPQDLFYNKNMEELGLRLPHAVHIVKLLQSKGIDLGGGILTSERLTEALIERLGRRE